MIKQEGRKHTFWYNVKKEWKRDWILYAMTLPVVIYLLIDEYYPMYGLAIAFKDFKPKKGILGSPWVGFKYFKMFFSTHYFETMLKNTLHFSLYSLVAGFTLPIVFAVMLNYLRSVKLKKAVQMVSYAPHFLSTVVLCSMITLFCTKDTGLFSIIGNFFGKESVNLLTVPELFDDIYVWSGVWQALGWNSIIYISALAGVDPSLHEAAIIDGATKVQRIWHIDLPSINPTIVMLLILRFGNIMSVGFEKVYLLQNALNYEASVTISTYVYEVGLLDGNYSFSTAVGLFNNLINITLMVGANLFCRKVLDESLF